MSIIGKQVLDILTAGMYSDPLMVLREYVQNAADSIDVAVSKGILRQSDAYIEITADGKNRSISVVDNGTGISIDHADEILSSVGVSTKDNLQQRGFRGIGRLGGLGYCDAVIFSSKSPDSDVVVECAWDSVALSRYLHDKEQIPVGDVVRRITKVSTRGATSEDPKHFFSVTMKNVHRFHRDSLMDPKQIKRYLSSVAPVPYNETLFPFSAEIERRLADVEGYKTYIIRFNGEPVFKPHTSAFDFGENKSDTIKKIQFFDVNDNSGSLLARGWYAETNFLASLPPRQLMRGVVVRQGNIEIGDEYFLSEHYSERRFTTWHIGEIHVSYSLRPNARRDGFEDTEEMEIFLEYANRLGRHLSNLCRESSKIRSSRLIAENKLEELARTIERSFFVDEKHYETTVESFNKSYSDIVRSSYYEESSKDYKNKLQLAQKKMTDIEQNPRMIHDVLDGRSLRGYSGKDIIQHVCSEMLEAKRKSKPMIETMYTIIKPYLKKKYDYTE